MNPISTAITIVSIAIILTVYASVLKRNGWIGKSTLETSLEVKTSPSQLYIKTRHCDAPKKVPKISKKQKQEPKISNNDTPHTKPNDKVTTTQRKTPEKIDGPQINRPEGCSHHFGYLATLPKGTNTPDECYSCTDLINCYKKN